ncbi:MAG: FAD-binding oxidoreductase [Rhodobacteraceae bacterium]|nr:FAD-binding oxidoreductase [Paracoccaceae bacterium]
MNYPDTYYAAEIGNIPQKPKLAGDITVDVCVIGAGLAGLTTALELVRKGKSVALLESHRVGWGASGRNGGSVLIGFAESAENIARKIGVEKAAKLHDLSREGAEYVRQQIADLNIKGALEGVGRYSAVRHGDTTAAKMQVKAANTPEDTGVVFHNHAETRKVLDTGKYHHTVFIPDGFHIQPLRYVLGLAAELERLGGQIFEDTKARSLKPEGGRWQVSCAAGKIDAKDVVLCTSGYDFTLYPKLSRAMLPIATYVMATKPMGQQLDKAIKTTSAISDTRRSGDYYRRLENDRLLWGGRITTRTSRPLKLAEMLKGDVVSVYPQLENIELTHQWEGLMGYTRHKMPLIGQVEKGLWMATAFGGHGLNTTAMAGCLIAAAIADQDETYKQFEAYKPVWAGGMFGRIAVQLIYWGMRFRDRLDERRKPE